MNWNISGHEWAVGLLKEHIAHGNFRHAYLLTGPEGIGRRTLAIRMAQALNCSQPPTPGEPCGVCRDCTQIELMQHPDLSIIQAEERGGTLRVAQIRDLQHSLALAPYQARYRVAILLRFEEAHASASNALLKTLEEPPPQVVIILTAESAESLLPTIVSRCEVLRLRTLPVEAVQESLESNWGLSAEDASLLAHLSGGRLGYAIQLHQNPDYLALRQTWIEDHHQLLSASRVKRFAYGDSFSKDKDYLRNRLQTWLSLWRDVLLYTSRASAPLANIDQMDKIQEMSKHFGLEAAYLMVKKIQQTQDLIDKNINKRLALEVLMLDLPRR